MSNQAVKNVLKNSTLIPVVTFQKEDDPVRFMEYLFSKNVFCIEITLRTDYGLRAIDKLKETYNDTVQVGAGTVINKEQIRALQKVGADFMVSPGLTEKLYHEMEASQIPFLPGVSTPSEIIQAQEFDLEFLKFFPANLYGGVGALKMFGGLFPGLQFCPTGGINEMTSKEYLKLDNVIAVGGSWFQKEFKESKI